MEYSERACTLRVLGAFRREGIEGGRAQQPGAFAAERSETPSSPAERSATPSSPARWRIHETPSSPARIPARRRLLCRSHNSVPASVCRRTVCRRAHGTTPVCRRGFKRIGLYWPVCCSASSLSRLQPPVQPVPSIHPSLGALSRFHGVQGDPVCSAVAAPFIAQAYLRPPSVPSLSRPPSGASVPGLVCKSSAESNDNA
jgi:hypothetical protein